MKIDNVSFNKEVCKNLSYKEFNDSFAHLLSKTPVQVAYKLVTGQNPPSKSKKDVVRKIEDSSEEGI